ncbi:MAG TPA: dCMP deaminase family protein [Candidatus Methanofastidiosa archaeon]|nr:dCMP deaminase family protein [Candidatus Methanofastidiosa archaeon]HPR41080.1 dCMP deaminase family protein [Candidatus Methanofastidiosa archaeon]
MERDDAPTYFSKIAALVSSRSTCIKQHVGAIIVKDKHIISTGYNGAPKGVSHCTEKTCLRTDLGSLEKSYLCRGVHAEQNAIIQAALHGTSTEGATLYTTHFPCMACTKILINSGIREIVYQKDYDMENNTKMGLLNEAGIKIRKLAV